MTTTIEKDDDRPMLLLLLADILNVVEHPAQDRQTRWQICGGKVGDVPLLYAQLCCACHHCSNDLAPKHTPWRYFHIVT